MFREFALGIDTAVDLDALARQVSEALGIELTERHGLNIGGGRYFSNWSLDEPDPEFHLVHNYGPDEDQWKYDDRDVAFVLTVWVRDAPLDSQQLLRVSRVTKSGRAVMSGSYVEGASCGASHGFLC